MLLTLCDDRLDVTMSGLQVEAPISHLTVLRDGGSPRSGGHHRSVRTMGSSESAPRDHRGGAPVVLGAPPVIVRGIFSCFGAVRSNETDVRGCPPDRRVVL